MRLTQLSTDDRTLPNFILVVDLCYVYMHIATANIEVKYLHHNAWV